MVGVLVGLEIPLLMRILRNRFDFKDVVAHVLTFDYLGALGASLLFPLFLVPHLGLVRSAVLFGMINTGVALWTTMLLAESLGARRWLQGIAVAVMLTLGCGWIWADRILDMGETNLYADDVVLAKTTRYQRIVLTAWKDDLRLFLNSHLQFSSKDEYRYHEALVHPGLSALPEARRVLVLGGGDGLAVREILKHPGIEHVTLVDLDPEMTRLFSTHPELTRLNLGALTDPRVHVVNQDAFVWLDETTDLYDFRGRRLSRSVELLGRQALHDGVLSRARQASSADTDGSSSRAPRRSLRARRSGASSPRSKPAAFRRRRTTRTCRRLANGDSSSAAGPRTVCRRALPDRLRFLTVAILPELFTFPPDMARVPVEPNRLNTQVLVRYYEREWRELNR